MTCLVVGMAGSGKTTLMQRVHAHLRTAGGKPGYFINLDPAAMHVPYGANIDIRDTVKFKEVMKESVGAAGALIVVTLGCTSYLTLPTTLGPGTSWDRTGAS